MARWHGDQIWHAGTVTRSKPHTYAVQSQTEHFAGPVFSVVTDEVTMPGGEVVKRDYLRHVGAVAVVALDERERVVLVHQYRHPVRRPLWELPAGLVDVPGERLPEVAARELAEEADLVAARWDVLVDLHTSPGVSDEAIRVFLARDLSPSPHPHPREHEEAGLTVARVPLDEAVAKVLSGQITNGPAVAGLLAAARARDLGWAPLRALDAPPPPPIAGP